MSVKTQKMIIGGCVAFLVIFWGYRAFSGESQVAVVVDGVEEALNPTDLAGQEILSLVDRLQRISITQEIFEDRSFTSLMDFTVNIFPEATGRPNPFAAIGFDNSAFVSQTQTQTASSSRTR
jgi:hypothetical protein